MQAAATAVGFSAVLPVKARPAARSTAVARVPATRRSVRTAAAAVVVAEPAEVDYSSSFSVFPMEACDLLGGDACIGKMFPEAKLAAAAPEASRRVDAVERDYLSYDGPKTLPKPKLLDPKSEIRANRAASLAFPVRHHGPPGASAPVTPSAPGSRAGAPVRLRSGCPLCSTPKPRPRAPDGGRLTAGRPALKQRRSRQRQRPGHGTRPAQAEQATAAAASMGHPYAPAELDLPGFVPLKLSQAEILVSYLGASLFVLLAVWLVSGRCGRLSKTDRLLMCWWAFTGLTHIMIEGPFVFTPDFFKKENPNFFDEVWKEYSKGDSRYVARDAATVTVEGITAVLEGPASLLAVYAIGSRKSFSHILQFAVCLGQLYGCLVYFITAYLDGFNFWVGPFYFWAYFIGANSFWIWIPMLIAIRSWKEICAAFQAEKVKTK